MKPIAYFLTGCLFLTSCDQESESFIVKDAGSDLDAQEITYECSQGCGTNKNAAASEGVPTCCDAPMTPKP